MQDGVLNHPMGECCLWSWGTGEQPWKKDTLRMNEGTNFLSMGKHHSAAVIQDDGMAKVDGVHVSNLFSPTTSE